MADVAETDASALKDPAASLSKRRQTRGDTSPCSAPSTSTAGHGPQTRAGAANGSLGAQELALLARSGDVARQLEETHERLPVLSKETDESAAAIRQVLVAKDGELSSCQARAAGLERLLQDLRGTMREHEERKGQKLIEAAEQGDLAVVRLLVEDGADVNAEDKEGSTALMAAARTGHVESFWLLLENGAHVNARNKHGSSPLMYAALNGHLDIARSLIENGADVNARNKNGWTPLMRAAYWGQLGVARLLTEKGADVGATDK
eukprot:jgi/Mesvir1/13344/Mv24003-RA.1